MCNFYNTLVYLLFDFNCVILIQPIIPVFTQNIREAFRCIGIGRRFWLRIYLWTRLPIVPIYGWFPVKLRTHIGKPIPYDPDLSAEDLQKKVLLL